MFKKLINYIKDDDHLIAIYSNNIYIRNYKNILDINSLFIKIEFSNKKLIIEGKNLYVKRLENNEIIINGVYEGLHFYE